MQVIIIKMYEYQLKPSFSILLALYVMIFRIVFVPWLCYDPDFLVAYTGAAIGAGRTVYSVLL